MNQLPAFLILQNLTPKPRILDSLPNALVPCAQDSYEQALGWKLQVHPHPLLFPTHAMCTLSVWFLHAAGFWTPDSSDEYKPWKRSPDKQEAALRTQGNNSQGNYSMCWSDTCPLVPPCLALQLVILRLRCWLSPSLSRGRVRTEPYSWNSYQETTSRMMDHSGSKPPVANEQIQNSCRGCAGEGLSKCSQLGWCAPTGLLKALHTTLMRVLPSIRPKLGVSEFREMGKEVEEEGWVPYCLLPLSDSGRHLSHQRHVIKVISKMSDW